eukprot:m.3432 g.3432  ORF g.3432 m.3432 type:complete len:722 (+) comp9377_c0_seq1:1030-3195(+)
MLLAAFAIASLLLAPSFATTVHSVEMPIVLSQVHPENLLPQFLFMEGSEEGGHLNIGSYKGGQGRPEPFIPDDSCPTDIFELASKDLRGRQLPYLTQDNWDCARNKTTVPVIQVENDYVIANIVPQWGGKVWSLYHKKFGKNILFANPAHQPANIGLRKAWTSGGCEWNWSPGVIGHGAFTESPVYLAQLDTELGPLLRVYEFDRLNETVWQVDMLFDGRDGTFWAHPKVTNTNPNPISGYWWTCAAHSITGESRVVTPALYTIETSAGPGTKSLWPHFNYGLNNASFFQPAPDMSYLKNLPDTIDAFVRIMKPRLPYIAHAAGDGYTVVHGHQLNGTKFFTWGQTERAQFWMDFLSASHGKGDYAELQVGPAPMQMTNFPVAAGEVIQWTEWFKSFSGKIDQLHSDNYSEALDAVETWMASSDGMSDERIAEMEKFFSNYSDHPVTKGNILKMGSSWGAVHELVTGKPLTPSTMFVFEESDETVRPWMELVKDGKFSDSTLESIPLSFQISQRWIDLLEKSAANHGHNWLTYLFLGVAAAEQGNGNAAKGAFNMSVSLNETAHGFRNLAVTSSDINEVYPYYTKAWNLALGYYKNKAVNAERLVSDLGAEIAYFLQSLNMMDELMEFLSQPLPDFVIIRDQVISAHASVALHQKNYDDVFKILTDNCFPTYGSDRATLINLWYQAHYQQEEEKLGHPLSILEAHEIRMQYPVPENIGYPY